MSCTTSNPLNDGSGWQYRIIPGCEPKMHLSSQEWKLATSLATDAAEAERQNAEQLHAESVRVKDEAEELAKRAHDEVEWRFEQRVADVKHWRDELNLKFAEINKEIDAQLIYKRRLENAVSSFSHILEIDEQIIQLRSCRVGVDLTVDEPQKQVMLETKIVQGIQNVLGDTVGLTTEQVRILRKTAFNLNKELLDKDRALEIDIYAKGLNVHRSEVQAHCLTEIADLSNVNELDWEELTLRNKEAAQKAINDSVEIRTRIDSLLRQSAEDVQKQICSTDRAFNRRLSELIEAKDKLQSQHADVISVNIREIQSVLCSLNKAFEEKKSAVGLAETRLNIRGRRPNQELVKDAVQRGLILELQRLNEAMSIINTKIMQMEHVLRNLNRNQLELEDEINIKMNSIGIDEAKVMILRKSILVQEF